MITTTNQNYHVIRNAIIVMIVGLALTAPVWGSTCSSWATADFWSTPPTPEIASGYLLSGGCDPNELVRFELEDGTSIVVSAVIHLAAGAARVNEAGAQEGADIVHMLLRDGASVMLRDRSGNTPLHRASHEAASSDAIKYLLGAGADPKATNNDGQTACGRYRSNVSDPGERDSMVEDQLCVSELEGAMMEKSEM